jgi:hypothetical protein
MPRFVPPRPGVWAAVLVGLGLLLVAGLSATAAAATTGSSSAGLALNAGGLLTVNLTAYDANGSALRYAMDGNFAPLITALPVNASTEQTILSQIELAENTPILSSYFGNHDGSVSTGETIAFVSLIMSEAKLIPAGSLTGTTSFSLTMDGTRATSAQLAAVQFSGAEGADTSTAPILASTTLLYQFSLGSSAHLLTFTTIVPTVANQLPTLGTQVAVSFATPAAVTITQTSGLQSVTVHNDVWGIGSASLQGTYDPLASNSVVIAFEPSYPTGYLVLTGVVIGGVVGAGAGLWYFRRRRRLAAARSSGGGVGPSGSA